jgi:twinkle protein
MTDQSQQHGGSDFIEHIPCDACGSQDNASLYTDGHTYCFGCGAYSSGDASAPARAAKKSSTPLGLLTNVDISDLPKRGITEATCKHFGYGISQYRGKPCQVAPYYDVDGELVAQKIRLAGKNFKVLGSLENALPFGAQCWPKTGRMIVVTEGEIDALSMSQVQGNAWPVISIGCGAGGQIKKYIARHRDYLCGFEKVVIMFDADEPGRTAAKVAARVLGSRAHIATLPLKDANALLTAGRTKELLDAMWRAEPYRPDGIVALEDLHDVAKQKPRMGLSWPWPALDAITYGIHMPYVYAFGAAVGAGKTDILKEVITHLVVTHKQSVGAFLLEEEPKQTAIELAAKVVGLPLHTPEGWDENAFERGWGILTGGPAKVRLYENFGMNDWDSIREYIEYLHHAEGIRHFVIDHLTALVADAEDERRELDRIMAELSGQMVKLGSTAYVVSHLTTPKGTSHEEGGRVEIKHMTGSRAIARWTFGALGFERNQQHENKATRHTTCVRVLKMRGFGWMVGECMWLKYDRATGKLSETTDPELSGTATHGFTAEDENDTAPTDGGRSDF